MSLSILFQFGAATNDCNVTIPFDKSEIQEHGLRGLLQTNVSIIFDNLTHAQIQLQNIRIVNNDGIQSPNKTFQFLSMRFEIAVRTGQIEYVDFNISDDYWSRRIKRKIINFLCPRLDSLSIMNNCGVIVKRLFKPSLI